MLFEEFWRKKGITKHLVHDLRLLIKIKAVEAQAKKRLEQPEEVTFEMNQEAVQWIKEASLQDVVDDMLKFAEDEYRKEWFNYMSISDYELEIALEDAYWARRKIPKNIQSQLEPKVRRKISEISRRFHMKLPTLFNKVRPEVEKKFVEDLREKALDWMKRTGRTNFTRGDVELFLMDEKIVLPSRRSTALKDILYRLVKEKIH